MDQKERIAAQFGEIVGDWRVQVDCPLSRMTTFKIGGPAAYVVTPSNVEELKKIIEVSRENGLRMLVLGKGSNILACDEGFRGVIVRLDFNFNNVKVNGTEVEAESGITLSALSKKVAEKGLGGLEFASGIPGTLGGAIYMNAGAAIFTDGKQVLGLNTSNNLFIGYEANTGLTHDTYIDGTDIKFRTGTTTRNIRMFINGSGNVGIGTTSPAYLLDVNGNAHFSSIYADGNIHLNQGQQIAFKIDNTYRNTITVNANELAIGYGTRPYRATKISGQSMHLYTYSGSAAAERLTILEGGNVGIGTTSPAYLLDVNGAARCTSIRVGDALLAWDSTNNALKVVKSDGTTACNFYATGGVSALGAGNGQIETLQVGTLELTSAAKISANSSNEITLTSTGLKLSDNTSKQLFAVDSTGALTIGSSTQGGNFYIYYNNRRYQLNISQAIANGILS